jgi:Cu2+-exporting ATPase
VALSIVHDLPGRLRLRGSLPKEAAILARGKNLRAYNGVLDASHSTAGVSLLVRYDPSVITRTDLLLALHEAFSAEEASAAAAAAEKAVPATSPSMAALVVPLVLRPFLPFAFRQVLAFRNAWPRLRKGLKSILRGVLDVDVLDAAAIGLCILRRDFRSLSTITLLLGLGEFLERWTKKRSEETLADSLARHTITARIRLGEEEVVVDAATLRAGDLG